MPNSAALPQCVRTIADPRRAPGRRHRLPVVLGLAAGATLCGMRGDKAISDWANGLGPQARRRFVCRREQGPVSFRIDVACASAREATGCPAH